MQFRFLNIPVKINPTFWVFLLFFTNLYRDPSMESLILGVVLIFSLLVHEYGHALTALYFGARPSINLEAFGGNAQYNNQGITPKQRFLITLNGPLFESLLIVVPYFLLKQDIFDNHSYFRYFLYATMRLNILWCLLNLIPVVPLDGGHMARYLLEQKFGEKGARASLVLGLICAALVAPYLYYEGLFFFGTLLVIFGFQNFQVLQQFRLSSGEGNPFSCYVKGMEAVRNKDSEKAKVLLKKLLKSKETKIKSSAIEALANIYFQEHKSQQSYDLLVQADHQLLKEGKCLLCKLAFDRKNYALVGKYSQDIYQIDPSYEIAVLNSQAFAHLNEPLHSGAWLETAARFGNDYREKAKHFLMDQTYDSVREQDAFKKYAELI